MPVQIASEKLPAVPGQASSRDISAQGIYLIVSEEFETGSTLLLELDLPPELSHGAAVRVQCEASIIRIDRLGIGRKLGVAAYIESYHFIREDPPGSPVFAAASLRQMHSLSLAR